MILTVPVTVQNEWTTIEVSFSGNPAVPGNNVAQIILDGGSVSGNTLFVDDMIFHR